MNFARTVLHLCSSFKSYTEIRDLPVTSSVKYLLKLMILLALASIPSAIRMGEQKKAFLRQSVEQKQ